MTEAELRRTGSSSGIAVVVSQLGRGGAERQTVTLLHALRDSDWRPDRVICLSEDLEPFRSEVTALGYPLDALPRGASFDLRRVARLRSELGRSATSLVHAVHLLASGYSFLATTGKRGVTVLPTIRGTVVEPGPIRSMVYRRMFRSSRVALANSHRGAAFVKERFGTPRDGIVVVPNGVDFDDLQNRCAESSVRSELGIPGGAPVVTFVGKDAAVKNVPRFISVWSHVSSELQGAHALLVGKGLDAEGRSKYLGPCPPARSHFLGPRGDVPAILAASDVLVLTSISEGAPNVVLESLGVGTPVVSTDVGDVARMVLSGTTGYVVGGDDSGELGRRVLEILDTPERFREAIAGDGARLRREYSVESMVDGTVSLWRLLLNS